MMRLSVSPHTHPESPISGSTVESMIDRAVALGRTHFAYTDPAYMTSMFKGWKYAQKKKLKYIPGIEVFFKDPRCEIVKGTKSDSVRYFKTTVYARNQEQFNVLSRLSSKEREHSTVSYGETYPLWNWEDLEECARAGLILCTGDVQDMVTKHLLTQRPELADKVLTRLKNMFKENLYVSIVGVEMTHTWASLVDVRFVDGSKEVLWAKDRVSTTAVRTATALELVQKPGKHHTLTSAIRGGVYQIYNKKISSSKLEEGYLRLPGGDPQFMSNRLIYALAKRHNVKVLYSDYAYYAAPEDKAVQDVRLSQDDLKEHTKRHMQRSEEAESYLRVRMGLSESETAQILQNNVEWAAQFDNFDLKYDYSIPEVVGEGSALEQSLEIIRKNGRLPMGKPEYLERLKYEISVLAKNGKVDLTPYFLPIRDVLNHYKESGRLTGPARGSAAGSLFLYLMGITQVDPIKHDLSFERFLSLDRILTGNWPDVDVDLVDRELLVGADGRSGYLYSRWGDKAAQVSTRILLRLKSAIKDVNRYMNNGHVDADVERLSKSLPPPPQGVSDKAFVFGFEDSDGNHQPGLIEINKDLQNYAVARPLEWAMVQRCLGISRQYSKHASAFVIANRPISSIVPVFQGNVTQYEAKAVEMAKLIKYDFLVINQLKDIELCMNLINKRHNLKMDAGMFRQGDKDVYVWDLPEDLEAYRSVWGGETVGVFQINTQAMIPFVQKIKPRNMNDLATILALVRPGPLDFVDPDTGLTMADEYVERREGRGTIKIPELLSLLPETYGVQVYQEQTSKVARQIGKMKPTDAEELRRVFSKKDKQKALAMKPLFMEGAVVEVGKDKAEMIWAQMETSSRYSFNKSHAVSYAMITYACMYLKHYFPLEWWAAVLSNADEEEITTKLFKHVKDKLIPPDINESDDHMTIDYEQQKIRAKLTVLRGLGDVVSKPIIANRPYKDVKDFAAKNVAGPSLAKKLIHCGVMDSLFPKGTTLEQKMQAYKDAEQQVAYEARVAAGKKPRPLKPASIDPEYVGMHPLTDYIKKKSFLPTLPMDLSGLVLKYGGQEPVIGMGVAHFGFNGGDLCRFFSGDELARLEAKGDIGRNYRFCAAGYVVDMSEFTYSGGERKALKMQIETDGYLVERVLWPDYETGVLTYPNDLVKGSIILTFLEKRQGKDSTRIAAIKVLRSV